MRKLKYVVLFLGETTARLYIEIVRDVHNGIMDYYTTTLILPKINFNIRKFVLNSRVESVERTGISDCKRRCFLVDVSYRTIKRQSAVLFRVIL